jgi:hypothetical protein
MIKLNCWEFKRCGRFRGGEREQEFGVCPVTTEKRLDTVHNGDNAGRACWVVANSMCGGNIQGNFAQKFGNCTVCDFYRKVKEEEFPNFQLTPALLKKMTAW